MPAPILLLDVMDTLVHDPAYEQVLGFFSMSRDELFAVKDKQAWIRFETGEIDEPTFAGQYFVDGRHLDVEGLKAVLRNGYRWLEGIEALLSDLRSAGLRMHALSNYPTWWEMVEQRLRVSDYVKWSFVSCMTGWRKPSPQAYLGAAAALGVAPSQCLFVDDRPKNCVAARALGMDAIRFEDARSLRAALAERGLLAQTTP